VPGGWTVPPAVPDAGRVDAGSRDAGVDAGGPPVDGGPVGGGAGGGGFGGSGFGGSGFAGSGLPPFDAGFGSGEPPVGCQCQGAPSGLLFAVALLALRRVRGAR